MSGAMHWEPQSVGDPKRFAEARHQVHSLVQWLARMQCSFGRQGDGEPVRLTWRGPRRAIEAGPFGDNLAIELRLPEMVLQFLEDGEAVSHPFPADDHSPAHVEAWLLVEMLHRGVDRSRFSKALPYDVSSLMSGDSAEFAPDAYRPELESLTRCLAGAANLLAQAAETPEPEIAVRPDTLSLESPRAGRGVLGFRPGTGACSEPVFYHRREAQDEFDDVLPISWTGGTPDAGSITRFLDRGRAETTH